jgi:hypothetical protein
MPKTKTQSVKLAKNAKVQPATPAVETKPVATPAVETKPVATPAVETKPVVTPIVEVKPAATPTTSPAASAKKTGIDDSTRLEIVECFHLADFKDGVLVRLPKVRSATYNHVVTILRSWGVSWDVPARAHRFASDAKTTLTDYIRQSGVSPTGKFNLKPRTF